MDCVEVNVAGDIYAESLFEFVSAISARCRADRQRSLAAATQGKLQSCLQPHHSFGQLLYLCLLFLGGMSQPLDLVIHADDTRHRIPHFLGDAH